MSQILSHPTPASIHCCLISLLVPPLCTSTPAGPLPHTRPRIAASGHRAGHRALGGGDTHWNLCFLLLLPPFLSALNYSRGGFVSQSLKTHNLDALDSPCCPNVSLTSSKQDSTRNILLPLDPRTRSELPTTLGYTQPFGTASLPPGSCQQN